MSVATVVDLKSFDKETEPITLADAITLLDRNAEGIQSLYVEESDLDFIKRVFAECVNLERFYIRYKRGPIPPFSGIAFNTRNLKHFGTCSIDKPDSLRFEAPVCLWAGDPACRSYLDLFKTHLPGLLNVVYFTGPETSSLVLTTFFAGLRM